MDSNKNETRRSIRVVMFPWLAYGHITPYLELAKKLTTKHSFIVYMCSTPATLACIDKKVPQNLSNSIKLVPFHLPHTQGLPSNFHTTNGLSSHLIPTLTKALDSSAKEFYGILEKLVPDLVIYDCFQPWAASVAKDLRIAAIEFITSGAASTSHLYHQLLHPGIAFPFSKDIYHRDYDDRTWLLETIASAERKKNVLEGARVSDRIVLIKGCREIEGKYIDYISSLMCKKYVPVGPLVILESSNPNDGRDEEIISWLDNKERKSTVFVSFGSECFITKEDIYEVAYGLELSKSNFIWVVRLPKGDNNVVSSMDEILPQGFLDRVRDRGRVLEGWGPQTKILGHANVGGFVSHCGWNSLMESMYFGVPIIAMPMHVDQPVNARLVEEVGVGVEVLRDKNRRFRRETIAAVIRKVVMEGSGRLVRERAAEMKEKLRYNGCVEIDEAVKEIVGLLQ